MDHHLVVIGGGPAGLASARTARRRGAQVTLVSDGPVGGDCTWTGCVPSKTLVEAAAAGVAPAAALARVRATVERIASAESAALLAAEGIDVVEGRARLEGGRLVRVGARSVGFARLVLATGTSPALPPIPGLDSVAPLTNETVFDLAAVRVRWR